MKVLLNGCLLALWVLFFIPSYAQIPAGGRAHLLLDRGWRFAFGHPYDPQKDFHTGTGYFSFYAKAGYGDGAAAPGFDDRAWRKLDVPHDWAVEVPFDAKGSHSHGYKAVGRAFPEASVGWYRRSFTVSASDLGQHISVQFDGVNRNAMVWVNGFYLGTEPSGYSSFEYDVSQYLHYGGENVIAVRADVSMEEGWFYEGAGIYRHVWLNKTAPLHVASNGTFVTCQVSDDSNAQVRVQTTVVNGGVVAAGFTLHQQLMDAAGRMVAESGSEQLLLTAGSQEEYAAVLPVKQATLWSIEHPYLYRLVTVVKRGGQEVDRYETRVGIRTIRFDANEGFFLNGKHVTLKGTNNHQDHAGVGVAMPDALQEFRIIALKAMGCNAYRCSHNAPTPELLDACDRLGMLVLDENRLMGITPAMLGPLKQLMVRDRNHPSIIAWSIGNEEWAIEGNIIGARVASAMQDYVRTIDTTRPVTAGISGGWGKGISTVIGVMGYNYIAHGSTDEQHSKFPWQPGMGTEEGSTYATRGIYLNDTVRQYIAAYDKKPSPDFYSIEEGWKHYAARDYLAGMFVWTGFDYRGESTPYSWPSVYSYFGMLDGCGFPKDDAFYLQAWWKDEPLVHILPHWNWKGREGQLVPVWVYSNCDAVELVLNKKRLGRKVMPRNGHLEWMVAYEPGVLEAIGFTKGKQVLTDKVETTGEPAGVSLVADKPVLLANQEDVVVLAAGATDRAKRVVLTAGDEVTFTVQGPARIIGVGNGDQTSHEADQYIDQLQVYPITIDKERVADGLDNRPETAVVYDDAGWNKAFGKDLDTGVRAIVYRGGFVLDSVAPDAQVHLFYKRIGRDERVYLNGQLLGLNSSADGAVFTPDRTLLRVGRNSVVVVAVPAVKVHSWDVLNSDPGVVQVVVPAAAWKRKLFSGKAQVIVQSTGGTGPVTVTASAPGLRPAMVTLDAKATGMRPAL